MINLYQSYQEALHAVQELEAASVPSGDISLIALNGKDKGHVTAEEILSSRKKKADAVAYIPTEYLAPDVKGQFFSSLDLRKLGGVGEVIGAGWLLDHPRREDLKVETKGHEDTSRLIDCMMVNGMSEEAAKIYVEAIRRGATLVGVKPGSDYSDTAERIMRQEHEPIEPQLRGHHYWTDDKVSEKDSAANRLIAVLIAALK